ncbi:hypothetical protein QRD02_10115 [Aequorivita sp. SDUM287046]|uniref:Peptidylprolyl isomerase n=1 Tax=Aequorivita aurantiaca TaxID=3053356 RepID=A0ABT8DIX2_9FLAO|nr:hypothetical protein [Aequorivita aurantiaca]MDN3724739.1 hypothetical protein [Aequorivita aurantiaca]
MKNVLTVFAFVAALFMGVQSSSAQELSQDKTRPEVIAKAETAQLTDALGLNGDQSRAVFRALVAKQVGYQKNADNPAEKKKLDDQLQASMKKTLSADQYAQWLKTNN